MSNVSLGAHRKCFPVDMDHLNVNCLQKDLIWWWISLLLPYSHENSVKTYTSTECVNKMNATAAVM